MRAKRYKHKESGRYFYLICIVNEGSRNHDLPATAVFYDEDANIWNMPLDEFLGCFELTEAKQ